MSRLKQFYYSLFTGILYGLSWPIFDTVNLSFLAWFAFVPLFIFLEKNQQNSKKWIFASYLSFVVFGCFTALWLFNFSSSVLQVAVLFFLEELWISMPFIFLFFINKKIGFDKSLWLLPFIWMIWEWIYLQLEFTMGTHLSAYTQSNNLWLIQYLDFTGMWGVSFWLLLFNVMLFKAYKAVSYTFKSFLFFKKIFIICVFMLGIPLIYSVFSFYKYDKIKGNSLQITVVPTKYSPSFLNNNANYVSLVEETLHKTDSVAFTMQNNTNKTDLFVWPETGLLFTMQETNLESLLFEAVNDWESALITGGKGISESIDIADKRTYVSGVLISNKKDTPNYHHKTVLTPGQEAIPYHSLLAKIPYFPIIETDARFYKKANTAKPLELITKNNKKYLFGVSLCFEQWHPNYWAEVTRNKATFFTHLAAEGWYGNFGVFKFMTNVTRMRAIENRKQVARSSNMGFTGFIDQMGNIRNSNTKENSQPITKQLLTNNIITFYAKYPNWFPILGLAIFSTLFLIQIFNLKNKYYD